MTTEAYSQCADCTAPNRCDRMSKCLQLPPGMGAALDDIFGVHRPGLSGTLVRPAPRGRKNP